MPDLMNARVSKRGRTTIGVQPETKELLDRLRLEAGVATFDDLVYELASRSGDQPGKKRPAPAVYEFDIQEKDIAPILAPYIARIAELEATAGALRGAMVLTDPESGVLFNALAVAHGKGERGTKGYRIQEPSPETGGFAREGDSGIFSKPRPAGFWLRCPSGVYLTERDDTLPDHVEELLRRREKEAKRTPAKRAEED